MFLALAVLALALPPFLVTNCWLALLGDQGVLRAWLPFRIYSPGGTIWILSLLLWPISLFAVLSAWRRLEAAQFECEPAMTDLALLRWLLLPVARGELALAAVVTFVLALNNFAVPGILQTKVLPDEMWVRFNTQFDTLGALKLSTPLVFAPLILLAWASRRAVSWPRIQGTVSASIFRRQLGSTWQIGCGAIASMLCFLSVGLPLAQITFANRTWAELPGAVEAGTGAIWNSFWFAALAASTVVVVGLAFCLRSRRREEPQASQPAISERQSPIRPSLLASIAAVTRWLPFFIPGVLIGIALIKIFNRPVLVAFYQSAGIVILAFVIRFFAPGWTAARHAVGSVDPVLTDAAKVEGATGWQMLRHVVGPQIAPQLAAAWYVVYLLCLWDVESMILVVPPGGETLALRIFNLLHYGHNAQVNALCLMLLAVAVAPLVGWVAWWKTSNTQHPTSNIQRNTKHQTRSSRETSNTRRKTAAHPRQCYLERSSRAAKIFRTTLNPEPRTLNLERDRRAAWRSKFEVQSSTVQSLFGCGLAALRFGVWSLRFLWCLVFGVWCFCPGCSPQTAKNEEALPSRFFQRAEVIGSRGVGLGEFNKPRSVAVDAQDNVYAVDMTGRVQKFSPDGRFLLSWQMPETTLGKPKGMGRDREGNILVIEPHYQRVNQFSPEGERLAQWGCQGTNAGCFTLPRAVTVNSRG
ncbi:MAG TPA: hypothetical protein VFR76_06015, partial [Verrucomicrobiae bacterium]|nr:hypothetical protein [Verrucomicrobiae bacterium]